MRQASENDLGDLVELEQELFEENWLSDSSLLRELDAPGLNLVEGNPIQGYILSRCTEELIDITRLGVTAEAQGRGIGRRLLTAVLLAADRPVLLSVRKTNAGALRLYRQNGFRIVGQIRTSWMMLRGQLPR